MEENFNEVQITRQHNEKIFRNGEAIFCEGDLRELINTIYSYYQYKSTQCDKLVQLINFLGLENNRYLEPELVKESKKLNDYLDTFWEFLKNNFYQGEATEDGYTIYVIHPPEGQSENEAFLAEFQLVSVDTENAYRSYRAAVIRKLQI